MTESGGLVRMVHKDLKTYNYFDVRNFFVRGWTTNLMLRFNPNMINRPGVAKAVL